MESAQTKEGPSNGLDVEKTRGWRYWKLYTSEDFTEQPEYLAPTHLVADVDHMSAECSGKNTCAFDPHHHVEWPRYWTSRGAPAKRASIPAAPTQVLVVKCLSKSRIYHAYEWWLPKLRHQNLVQELEFRRESLADSDELNELEQELSDLRLYEAEQEQTKREHERDMEQTRLKEEKLEWDSVRSFPIKSESNDEDLFNDYEGLLPVPTRQVGMDIETQHNLIEGATLDFEQMDTSNNKISPETHMFTLGKDVFTFGKPELSPLKVKGGVGESQPHLWNSDNKFSFHSEMKDSSDRVLGRCLNGHKFAFGKPDFDPSCRNGLPINTSNKLGEDNEEQDSKFIGELLDLAEIYKKNRFYFEMIVADPSGTITVLIQGSKSEILRYWDHFMLEQFYTFSSFQIHKCSRGFLSPRETPFLKLVCKEPPSIAQTVPLLSSYQSLLSVYLERNAQTGATHPPKSYQICCKIKDFNNSRHPHNLLLNRDHEYFDFLCEPESEYCDWSVLSTHRDRHFYNVEGVIVRKLQVWSDVDYNKYAEVMVGFDNVYDIEAHGVKGFTQQTQTTANISVKIGARCGYPTYLRFSRRQNPMRHRTLVQIKKDSNSPVHKVYEWLELAVKIKGQDQDITTNINVLRWGIQREDDDLSILRDINLGDTILLTNLQNCPLSPIYLLRTPFTKIVKLETRKQSTLILSRSPNLFQKYPPFSILTWRKVLVELQQSKYSYDSLPHTFNFLGYAKLSGFCLKISCCVCQKKSYFKGPSSPRVNCFETCINTPNRNMKYREDWSKNLAAWQNDSFSFKITYDIDDGSYLKPVRVRSLINKNEQLPKRFLQAVSGKMFQTLVREMNFNSSLKLEEMLPDLYAKLLDLEGFANAAVTIRKKSRVVNSISTAIQNLYLDIIYLKKVSKQSRMVPSCTKLLIDRVGGLVDDGPLPMEEWQKMSKLRWKSIEGQLSSTQVQPRTVAYVSVPEPPIIRTHKAQQELQKYPMLKHLGCFEEREEYSNSNYLSEKEVDELNTISLIIKEEQSGGQPEQDDRTDPQEAPVKREISVQTERAQIDTIQEVTSEDGTSSNEDQHSQDIDEY